MTGRISDELNSDLSLYASRDAYVTVPAQDMARITAELQQSRALVAELRALAERTRIDRDALAGIDHYRDTYQERDEFLQELLSLLASHGEAKP